jgi:hypothetical protein
MSSTALMWAATVAPIADVQEYAILVRMADEADEAGCGVYLSTSTIASDVLVNAKTVQRRLDAMEARGLIGRGDQALVARIRADRRPTVWDLLIPAECFADLARTNKRRAEKGLPAIDARNRPMQLPPADQDRRTPRNDIGKPRGKKLDEQRGYVESETVDDPDGATSSPLVDGGTTSHPDLTGGLPVPDGVTASPARGDYQSPNPGFDPGFDPGTSPSSTPHPDAPATEPLEEEDENDPTNTEIASLVLSIVMAGANVDPLRRPSGAKLTSLVTLLTAKLDAKWTADQLVTAVGESFTGAKSVYGVLRHRLKNLPEVPPALPRAPETKPTASQRRCRAPGPGHHLYPADQCPLCDLNTEDAGYVTEARHQQGFMSGRDAARIAASSAAGPRPRTAPTMTVTQREAPPAELPIPVAPVA